MTASPVLHSDRQRELLDMLSVAAIADRSGPVSLRQFAIRAGVSEPTLRHFFTNRQGVVIAILHHFARQANSWLGRSAEPVADLGESVKGYLDLALQGFDNSLFVQAHAFALVESIHDPVVARAYLDIVVEPSLKAIETRLAPGIDPDGNHPDRVRHGALALYSTMLFAILHQRLLHGDESRPLAMDAFFADLIALFSRGAGPRA
ncbi:MAG: TetR family transcriptional regulator [Oceanicaulis sp. HLUCCA04]|nr:MAG: TetR family transcriptional regulator [Oceanicaulis sp. HLUCCA04]